MSTETDKNKTVPEFHADDLRRRTRRHRMIAPLWQTSSLVLHLFAFALLVLCTPVRELVIPAKKESSSTMSKMSAKQIENMADNIQDVYRNDMIERLESLKDMLDSIENMREEMTRNYDDVSAKESEHADKSMTEIMDVLVKKMSDAAAEQNEAAKKLETEIVPAAKEQPLPDKGARDKYDSKSYDAQGNFTKTATLQADAQSLMDAAANRAELVGFDEIAKAAAELRNIQLDANVAQSESQRQFLENRTLFQSLADSVDWKRRQNESQDRSKNELAQKEAERAERETKKNQTSAAYDEAKRQHANASDNLKRSEEKQRKSEEALRQAERDKAAQDRLNQLRSERNQANSDLNGARDNKRRAEHRERETENQRRDAENRLRQTNDRINQVKSEISRRQNEISETDREIAEAKTKLEKSTPNLIPAQKKASDAQKALVETAQMLAKKIPDQKPVPASESEKFDRADAPSFAEFRKMDVVEAYDAAKSLELAVSESYRGLKATELAVRQKMSIRGASELIDVAMPERGDVDRTTLRSSPGTESEFNKQKEETQKTVREVDTMVDNANSILENAYAIVEPYMDGGKSGDDANGDSRLDRMYAFAEIDSAMTSAAAEDSGARAKDLSSLMKMAGEAMQSSGEGKENSENKTGKGAAGDGGHDNKSKGAVKISSGDFGKMSFGKPGKDPSISRDSPGQEPGNIIGTGGMPAEWMYVNSWYVIGPFPNPNRINLRRKFPPESVIDLDATYIGKNGKQIKWEYEQAGRYRGAPSKIVPATSEQYGIWYAYTEIFLDRECDLWIAVGSDDRSDIWINGMNVWGSSNDLKCWSVDEGFRKVHFRKGRNKILYRVENGWHLIEWSMCIKTTEE